MFKVNNKDRRYWLWTDFKHCSSVSIVDTEQVWIDFTYRSDVFIVDFEQKWKDFTHSSGAFIIDFEQENVRWDENP